MAATTREHALERAVARVDLGAVERNCAPAARRCSAAGTELCAVVKADGYGHGAVPCAARGAGGRRHAARGRDGGRGGRAAPTTACAARSS